MARALLLLTCLLALGGCRAFEATSADCRNSGCAAGEQCVAQGESYRCEFRDCRRDGCSAAESCVSPTDSGLPFCEFRCDPTARDACALRAEYGAGFLCYPDRLCRKAPSAFVVDPYLPDGGRRPFVSASCGDAEAPCSSLRLALDQLRLFSSQFPELDLASLPPITAVPPRTGPEANWPDLESELDESDVLPMPLKATLVLPGWHFTTSRTAAAMVRLTRGQNITLRGEPGRPVFFGSAFLRPVNRTSTLDSLAVGAGATLHLSHAHISGDGNAISVDDGRIALGNGVRIGGFPLADGGERVDPDDLAASADRGISCRGAFDANRTQIDDDEVTSGPPVEFGRAGKAGIWMEDGCRVRLTHTPRFGLTTADGGYGRTRDGGPACPWVRIADTPNPPSDGGFDDAITLLADGYGIDGYTDGGRLGLELVGARFVCLSEDGVHLRGRAQMLLDGGSFEMVLGDGVHAAYSDDGSALDSNIDVAHVEMNGGCATRRRDHRTGNGVVTDFRVNLRLRDSHMECMAGSGVKASPSGGHPLTAPRADWAIDRLTVTGCIRAGLEAYLADGVVRDSVFSRNVHGIDVGTIGTLRVIDSKVVCNSTQAPPPVDRDRFSPGHDLRVTLFSESMRLANVEFDEPHPTFERDGLTWVGLPAQLGIDGGADGLDLISSGSNVVDIRVDAPLRVRSGPCP